MQCSQCGTELPEQARFCLQCGTPVGPAEPPAPGAPTPPLDFVQPALAGGMFLGILSSLPIVAAGNIFCCMWVLGGGAIAAYMLHQQRPGVGITYGDGAFGGVMSGLFGAIVATLLSIPLRLLFTQLFDQRGMMEQVLEDYPIDEPLRGLFLSLASAEITVTTVIFTFVTNLIMYSLFAMVGGILAVAVLQSRKRK